jgi:hypothetical protein
MKKQRKPGWILIIRCDQRLRGRVRAEQSVLNVVRPGHADVGEPLELCQRQNHPVQSPDIRAARRTDFEFAIRGRGRHKTPEVATLAAANPR